MKSGQKELPGSVLLIAGSASDMPRVHALLSDAGIGLEANPDLHMRDYRQFGIDDALALTARAATRAVGDRRVFVIVASSMTSEAQNALLKTLEEPPDDALFVFVVPSPETLLQTVRSRSQLIALPEAPRGEEVQRDAARIDPRAFFDAAPAARIDMLKPVLEKDDDDKYDTGAILSFLRSLEVYASRARGSPGKRAALEIIYRTRGYITDRGALVKTLLESVALLSPQV